MFVPIARNIKRYFSLKELIIVCLAVIISVSVGVVVFLNLKYEVVINDDGKQVALKTMKTTVKEVLEQNGVKVSPDDYMEVRPAGDSTTALLDRKLQKMNTNEIYIKRAVPINVFVDGQQMKIMTYRDTLKETLDNNQIKLSEKDRLEGAKLDDKIVRDMSVKIVRVKEEVTTENISIPYKVVSRENNRLDKGTERTAREGKEGIREKLFKVVMEDGKEITRELLKDSLISNPIDKIVEIGTILNHKTSRGEVVRYSKVLNMRSTAYTASFADTGKNPGDPGFGITYTGMKVRKGVIAVDPRVIPLGTRVYIEVAGNTPDYGYAIAADTGGAIKGDLIDLYYDDSNTAKRWGCKKVKVYILTN